MKRGIVAGLVALCALGSGAGTSQAQSRTEIETKVGATFSKFMGDVSGAKDKTGFAGGVAIPFVLNGWITVQPELSYVMKGTSYGTVTDFTDGTTTYVGTYQVLYALDYLELPVLFRVSPMRGSNIRPALLFGPTVGWKVLEKLHLRGMGGSSDLEGKGDGARALDLAATGGLSFELGPVGRCAVLDARYTQSLSNVQKPEYPGTVKNSDFRMTLGWRTAWGNMSDF